MVASLVKIRIAVSSAGGYSRSRVDRLRQIRGRSESGYTLVAAVVLVTVVTVLVAAALPSWSHAIQRDKEEELIFRGLQYAEAIRVFQTRFGRYPVRLDELIKVNPRCIRQLWKDPMTKEGEWGLVYAQGAGGSPAPGARQGRVAPDQPQAGPVAGGSAPSQLGGRGGRRSATAAGPILGVHSKSSETAIKQFAGGAAHSDWLFTADALPVNPINPVTQMLVRANSTWEGRPFPPGLGPPPGGAPDLQQGSGPSRQIQRGGRPRGGQRQVQNPNPQGSRPDN